MAVQQAVASTALGGAWLQPLQPAAGEGSPRRCTIAVMIQTLKRLGFPMCISSLSFCE